MQDFVRCEVLNMDVKKEPLQERPITKGEGWKLVRIILRCVFLLMILLVVDDITRITYPMIALFFIECLFISLEVLESKI